MPRVKRPGADERAALRLRLHDEVAAGGLPWSQTIRRMRQALGMTQEHFARAVKLTRRQVIALEAGTANPTIETLEKIGRPFGYQVGFILPRAGETSPSAEPEAE